MKHRMRLRDWLAAATPLALLAFIFLAGPVGAWHGWASDTTAYWAQAALSALAVFAAIGVVWWQIVHAQRERRKDKIHRLHILGTSVFFCRVQVTELILLALVDVPDADRLGALRDGVDRLKAAPIYDAPTWHASFFVARITAAFPELLRQWDVQQAQHGPNIEKVKALTKFSEILVDAEKILQRNCLRLNAEMAGIKHVLSTLRVLEYGVA